MMVLCSNVFTRVLVQWSLTLMVVPMLAQSILDGILWVVGLVVDRYNEWEQIDELESHVFDFYCLVRDYWNHHVYVAIVNNTPPTIMGWALKIWDILEEVPEAVWSTVPVTLISCVLGCLVVPYCIFKIDEFFDWLADRNKAKLKANHELQQKKTS